MSDKCNCVVLLNMEVKKRHDPEGWVETKLMVNLQTGESHESFPPVYFFARDKNKKGELIGKPRKKHFTTPYCPMCGKLRP
jgi:hypothetical protein